MNFDHPCWRLLEPNSHSRAPLLILQKIPATVALYGEAAFRPTLRFGRAPCSRLSTLFPGGVLVRDFASLRASC